MAVVQEQRMSLDELIGHLGFGKHTAKVIIAIGGLNVIDGISLAAFGTNTHALNFADSQNIALLITGQVGMAVGGFYWGWLTDKTGRSKIALACSVLTLYFILLSGFEPASFGWSVVLRSIVGFGTGGSLLAPCYLSEVAGSKIRGKAVMSLWIFFGLGNIYVSLIAWLTMSKYGWTRFLIISSIPIPFFVILVSQLPESVQYLRNSGDYNAMLKILRHISVEHNRYLPVDNFEVKRRPANQDGNVRMLLGSRYFLKLVVMVLVSFGTSFCYFGSVLQHIKHFKLCSVGVVKNGGLETTCALQRNDDYLQDVYGALADILAVTLIIPLVDFFGRKRILMCLLVINAVSYIISLYVIQMISTASLTYFIYIFRACSSATMATTVLYSTELFPTAVRGCALAVCALSMRVSFVAVACLLHTFHATWNVAMAALFIGLCLLCILLSLLLPETKGKPLESAENENR